MLYVFGFTQIGVALSDIYFVDPSLAGGQDGAERGVRLELRFIAQPERDGSVYASRPIMVDRPIWRADLLESVTNPGSLDRAHHHPKMRGWEPGRRRFEPELTADPVGWVEAKLRDLTGLLEGAGIAADEVDSTDAEQLEAALPEIVDAVRHMLARIGAGELAETPPGADGTTLIRTGWL